MLATGKDDAAEKILRQVAAENNEDTHLLELITDVYKKTGNEEAGKSMLDQVGAENIELNNRGVMAARALS